MLLLSSCDKKENGLEIKNASSVEFIASMPSAGIDATGTKTTTTDGIRVLWCNNDHVSIFRGRNVNDEYKVKDGQGGKTTTTFVWANDGEFSAGSEDVFDANIAYYPYGSIEYVGSNGNHALSVTIPNTQRYVKGSFGEGSLPMIAVSSSKSDNSLAFKNVFGLLKLQLKSADETVPIKEIVIKGNNNEKLSGDATVNCSANGEPTISFNSNAGNSITLECNNTAINATTATDFWIALPPVTFSKGITVEIVTSAAPIEKKTSASLTITRSKVKPMEELVIKVDMEAELYIPDTVFKEYLLENCDMNGDGRLTLLDAEEWNKDKYIFKEFLLDKKDIRSLKGIEYFTALKSLKCNENYLTSLDISNNTALEILSCYANKLTSLDVSKNTALETLNCVNNQLTSLDLSKNTALEILDCFGNQLTSLDVRNNTALTELNCSRNQLTSIDVSKNTALTELYCSRNQLTPLDVSKNTALTWLDCSENQLTALDVRNNTALKELNCSRNQLTSLDVRNNTALTELDCFGNQLTSLDVSKNTALIQLDCGDNQLTSLDVSKNTALRWLYCNMPSLKALYLKKGQQIDGITYNRSFKYINNNTEINPIEIKQVKDNELVDLVNGNADEKDFAVNYDIYFMGKLMVKGGVAMTGDETVDGVANTIKAADYVDVTNAKYGAFFELVNSDLIIYRDVTKVSIDAKDGKFQWRNAGTKLQTPVVAAYVTYTFKTSLSEATVKSNIIVIPEE